MAKTLAELKAERAGTTKKKVTTLADLKASRGYVEPKASPVVSPSQFMQAERDITTALPVIKQREQQSFLESARTAPKAGLDFLVRPEVQKAFTTPITGLLGAGKAIASVADPLIERLTGIEQKTATSLDKPIGALERFQQSKEAQSYQPQTKLGGLLKSGAESTPQMLAGIGLGPTKGAALMGTFAGGQEFIEAEKAGATVPQALGSAAVSGAAEGLLSRVSLGLWDKLLKTSPVSARPVLEKGLQYLGSVAGEAGEEAGTEVLQFLGRKVTYDKEGKLDMSQVAEAGAVGGLMAIILGGLGAGSIRAQRAIESGNVTEADVVAVANEQGIQGNTVEEITNSLKADPNLPTIQGMDMIDQLAFDEDIRLGEQAQDRVRQAGVDLISGPVQRARQQAEQALSNREQIARQSLIPTIQGLDVDETLDSPFDTTPIQPSIQPTQPITPKLQPKPSMETVGPVRTMAESIDDGGISMTMTLDELNRQQEAVGEPIDTMTRVLTEVPKKSKRSLSDRAERVYQEIFSTNVPFERVGGKAQVQGSNLNRLQGTVEYNVVGKQTSIDNKEVGKSIVDIYSDIKAEDKQSLFDYALNKHNIDRWEQGKPVFGETVSADTSAEKVNQYEQSNPQFAQKQQEITGYFRNLMNEWAVKSGLVSQETADMLAERYPNYVPTYRAKDFPKAFVDRNQNISQMIKKAKGGEDFILPIDQQMIAMTDRTIRNAKRNELMNTLATAFEEGNPKAQRYITKITKSDADVVGDFLDVGSKLDAEPVQKGQEYVVNFYTDGVPRQMTVNRTLYKALETAQADTAINEVAKTVRKYAVNPFKALITGYNPIFAASNIMRDVPTALTYSDDPMNMTKQVPEAVKEMLTNGEKFRLFKALGGTREGLIGSDKTFKVPTMNETKTAFDKAQKFNPIKTVGDVNNFTETLPRFSEFMNVLEKTGDPALAVYKSAELTTDFSRHGKLTKFLDNFVPYLNPSVQGIDKFARSAINDPVKTAIKGAAVITLPTMLLDFINRDDEEYNNLQPRERNLYFNIPFTTPSGEKQFLRIPKSRELGVAFSSIYEWAARKARGQEVTGEEIAQTISENFTPADINSPIWTPALKAWRQIKDPEAYETNYWGGLIVPTSQRKYSPGEQYDLNSSGIAKAIGQQFEVSPYVVDYLIKSYGGIIGQTIQPIGADRKFGLLAPLEKKFINDPVFKSNAIENFYTELDKSKKEAQDYNKRNDIPSKIVTPLEKKANALNKVSLQLSEIRKEQKELQTKKGTEDRVKELQEAMNRMAIDALNKNK